MSSPYWRWRTTSASHHGGSSLLSAPAVIASAITWYASAQAFSAWGLQASPEVSARAAIRLAPTAA